MLSFLTTLNRSLWPLLVAVICIAPIRALAHEVYVLDGGEIATGISSPPFDMVQVALDNLHQFIFWGFIVFVVVSTIFFMSIFRLFEVAFAPLFARLRPYAPVVARVTVGIGFIASGYFGAIFGPELPLSGSFGPYAQVIGLTLIGIGALVTIGLWARTAAAVALALFGLSTYIHGSYMLTYVNYLGEILVLLLIGSHRVSVDSLMGTRGAFRNSYLAYAEKMKHLAFPILRVAFGISLIYASVYAKILHNGLALQVASLPLAGHAHPLAYYFGFEPHFLVLGAALIEILLGLFYVFGVEIRWTSLFLLFWLSLSLWYFGESVWPHIVLIGIPIAFVMHGYDYYSLEGRFFKKGRLEPVL